MVLDPKEICTLRWKKSQAKRLQNAHAIAESSGQGDEDDYRMKTYHFHKKKRALSLDDCNAKEPIGKRVKLEENGGHQLKMKTLSIKLEKLNTLRIQRLTTELNKDPKMMDVKKEDNEEVMVKVEVEEEYLEA